VTGGQCSSWGFSPREMPAFPSCVVRIERVTQKMLTQTLRGLERDGLVRRTVYPEAPVRIEYALTDAGRTLQGPLRALQDWSIEHLTDVSASQHAFDDAGRPARAASPRLPS